MTDSCGADRAEIELLIGAIVLALASPFASSFIGAAMRVVAILCVVSVVVIRLVEHIAAPYPYDDDM